MNTYLKTKRDADVAEKQIKTQVATIEATLASQLAGASGQVVTTLRNELTETKEELKSMTEELKMVSNKLGTTTSGLQSVTDSLNKLKKVYDILLQSLHINIENRRTLAGKKTGCARCLQVDADLERAMDLITTTTEYNLIEKETKV